MDSGDALVFLRSLILFSCRLVGQSMDGVAVISLAWVRSQLDKARSWDDRGGVRCDSIWCDSGPSGNAGLRSTDSSFSVRTALRSSVPDLDELPTRQGCKSFRRVSRSLTEGF